MLLQIIGQMRQIKIPFHPILAVYIRIAAVAQLNLEIMQHQCILGEDEHADYAKVRLFFWLPFLLFLVLGLLGCLLHLLRARSSLVKDLEASRSQLVSFGCGLFNLLYVLQPHHWIGPLRAIRLASPHEFHSGIPPSSQRVGSCSTVSR